jgi:hypothetical protein
VLGHSIVNAILVVGAVGNDRGERLLDLIEQGPSSAASSTSLGLFQHAGCTQTIVGQR